MSDSSRRAELLITTGALAGLLADPAVRVVDVRFGLDDEEAGARAYARERIPGAVYLHWHRDLSDPDDPTPGQLAPPGRFRAAMEQAGIGDSTLVVAYDDGVLFMAARLAWSLHVYGHGSVRVLDGGIGKWRREGRPLESGPPAAPPQATFTPRPRVGLRLTKDQVLAGLGKGRTRVLDCRMDETWAAAGMHVPGARRLPAPSLVDRGDGTLLGAEELARLAAEAGAAPEDEVVLYCGGGVSASLAWLALESAGFRDLAVYDGSWSEWGSDPATPKEPHGQARPSEPRGPAPPR